MNKAVFAFALLLLAAVPASAQCPELNFTYTQSLDTQITRFTFTNVPGAIYTLEEFATEHALNPSKVDTFFQSNGVYEVRKRMNLNRLAHYRLTMEANGMVCRSQRIAVGYVADPVLVKALNRAAIPIVGSTPGANGSLWKTYVRFTATQDSQIARVVFHPAGQAGSPGDPEVTLRFAKAGDFQEWNDIVPELFHRTGLGTIDIYPLSSQVPIATTRIYNDGPQGRFGAFVDQVQPADYLIPTQENVLTIAAPGPNYRVNIGVRAFDQVQVQFVLRGPDGVVKETRVRTFLQDQVVLATVEDIVGIPMQPGDTLRIAPLGAAVPFYSLTDQSSNDPAYFTPDHPVKTFIPFVETPFL